MSNTTLPHPRVLGNDPAARVARRHALADYRRLDNGGHPKVVRELLSAIILDRLERQLERVYVAA